MKRFSCRNPYALALPGILIACTALADNSPMDYFAEQDEQNAKKNAPILAATTTDELIRLGALPARYADAFAEMAPEEVARYIDSVKQNLDSGRAVAERIDGDRAVVLRESAYAGSWNKLVKMTRTNGEWAPSGEVMMQSDSGATGSFTVSGMATAELTDAQVVQSGAYPDDDGNVSTIYLTISDILSENLTGKKLPAVSFSYPKCLTKGSHSISYPRGEFTTAGQSMADAQSFSENIAGTMTVSKIEGDRFWASFEMTAVLRPELGDDPDPAKAVRVTGSISNASNLCPGDGGA